MKARKSLAQYHREKCEREGIEPSTLSLSPQSSVKSPEKPAPPSKPRPPIKKRGKRAKRMQCDLDACYAIVDGRSGGVCEYPGCLNEAKIHHHVITRGSDVTLRHEPRNIAHLCAKHEREAHADMLAFQDEWAKVLSGFAEIRNEGKAELARARAHPSIEHRRAFNDKEEG